MPHKVLQRTYSTRFDALIVWITPDRPLEPGINRFRW